MLTFSFILPFFLLNASANPVYPSWIHTDGPLLRNSNNEQVLFQGAAIVNLGESGLSSWNCNITDVMYQYYTLFEGKANVIRIATGLDAANGNWSNVQVFYSALDEVINLAYQYQINVVIEFHGGLNQSAFNNMMLNPNSTLGLWFTDLATRYLTNATVIGFELYNEPNGDWTNQTSWRTFMNNIVDEIDAVNPNALQIVASVPFGSISSDYISNPMPYNVVYGFDFYYGNEDNYWKEDYAAGNWTGGFTKTDTMIRAYAIYGANNLPKWETEFGYFNDYAPTYPDANNEVEWERQMADHIQVLATNNVNYYIYDFSFGLDNMALHSGNALTPYGQVLLASMQSTENNWAMLQHDESHTGYSSTEEPMNFSLLWKYPPTGWVGLIFSSPAVANGILYVGSGDADRVLRAINATDGTSLWNYTTDYVVESSPAVANDIVYVGGDDGNLYAVNATTGAEIWVADTSIERDNGIWGSPVVSNGRVFILPRNSIFRAFNATDGTSLWNYTSYRNASAVLSIGSPAISNGVVYIPIKRDLYALNESTGEKLWNFTTPSDDMSTSPTVSAVEGLVYVGSGNKLYALHIANGTQAWQYNFFVLGGTPSIANGIIYRGADDGQLYALNASTGTEIWISTISNGMTETDGAPAIDSGAVYIGDYAGFLGSFNATTGAEIWRNDSIGGTYFSNIMSSPALYNGTLYVSTLGGSIFAINGGVLNPPVQPTPTPTPIPTATPTPAPEALPVTINVQPFWQYLYQGNLWGFFQAIFLFAFGIQDLLYGSISMLFLVPLYIKTKSLLLLSVLWILLGGFFITAMPAVSGLAIVFLILGIGGVLWRLVHPTY